MLIEENSLVRAHVVLIISASVLFLLSFVMSLAVILQESQLKKKQFGFFQRRLPPLEILDRLNTRVVHVGFWTMLAAIVLAVMSEPHITLTDWFENFGFVVSVLALIAFAILEVARFRFGYRGRRAAWLTVAAFGLFCLSFVGVHLFSGATHAF